MRILTNFAQVAPRRIKAHAVVVPLKVQGSPKTSRCRLAPPMLCSGSNHTLPREQIEHASLNKPVDFLMGGVTAKLRVVRQCCVEMPRHLYRDDVVPWVSGDLCGSSCLQADALTDNLTHTRRDFGSIVEIASRSITFTVRTSRICV